MKHRSGFTRLSRWNLQSIEPLDQFAIFPFTLAFIGFNKFENRTQSIEQLQQPGNKRGTGGKFSIPQQAQQVLTRVRKLFQPMESKKSCSAFDRMHRPKDLGEKSRILRARLEFSETPLHAVQSLLALDQELPRQIVH